MTTAAAYDDEELRARLEELALAAGRAILDVVRHGFEAQAKPDASPVTEADRAAEEIILAGLRRSFPDIPCVAEEEASAGLATVAPGDRYFLIDPLDGTREFVSHRPDYTVNIALIREGLPEVGVVLAPAKDVLFSARPGLAERVGLTPDGAPAIRHRVNARPRREPPLVVASRSHLTAETSDYILECGAVDTVNVGSSLKFCILASGEADLYPRFGRTMQWDTAAGDAILRAAGGHTRTIEGASLAYGPRPVEGDEWANPSFIASGADA